MVINLRLAFRILAFLQPDKKIDAHANLNPKDIVRRAGEFWVLPHVAAEVEDENFIKIFLQLLSHPVKSFFGCKTVVIHEANDATVADAVTGVTNGFHIRVREFAEQRGF